MLATSRWPLDEDATVVQERSRICTGCREELDVFCAWVGTALGEGATASGAGEGDAASGAGEGDGALGEDTTASGAGEGGGALGGGIATIGTFVKKLGVEVTGSHVPWLIVGAVCHSLLVQLYTRSIEYDAPAEVYPLRMMY